MTQRIKLPIDPHLKPLAERLKSAGSSLILRASPGCGKTTRVPPALLEVLSGEVWVLEPRRLAAKHSAMRVADEMHEKLGGVVGYQFRLENMCSRETRLRFVTEGILLRRLMSDPTLRGVDCVILDEFHERHLQSDLALASLRHLRETTRPDLRIVVMSATLDTDSLAAYLPSPEVLTVDAPVYPVEITHLPSPPDRGLEPGVAEAVSTILSNEQTGNILVFLPGMGEILRCEQAIRRIRQISQQEIDVILLHGSLSKEEQARAFEPGGRRRIVLSTNIAETSLTLPDITAVIDSGLHRQASHSWWSGVPALKTRPISRASAIQRAGRAGRTAPGRCLRLYTQGDFQSRAAFETPEIRRADLTQSVLELKALGVGDLGAFPWFERPEASALVACERLLYLLGGLSSSGELTAMGQRMAEIPAHPRVSRLLIEAEKQGHLDSAASLSALLQEGGLDSSNSLDALANLRGPLGGTLKRSKDLLLSQFSRSAQKPVPKPRPLEFCVLTGFPDRVGMKRGLSKTSQRGRDHETEILLSSGGSALVSESGIIAEQDFFVALEIQEMKHANQTRSQLKVRSVVGIERDWLLDLEPSEVREQSSAQWDAERGRVRLSEQLLYGDLVLDESQGQWTEASQKQAAALLLKHGLGLSTEAQALPLTPHSCAEALGRVVEGGKESAELLIARALFVAEHLKLPTQESLLGPLLAALEGKTSLKELQEVNWGEALLTSVLGDQAHRAQTLAPESVALPSGRKVRVHYKLGQAPWVESRMQDFFGLKRGPTALDGKLPIVLHLLAPNHRPVQVTTDLEGFWKRGYAELKGQLSRRYPRHYWPDDPLVAEPPPARNPHRR